jgi:hypothetical protein
VRETWLGGPADCDVTAESGPGPWAVAVPVILRNSMLRRDQTDTGGRRFLCAFWQPISNPKGPGPRPVQASTVQNGTGLSPSTSSHLWGPGSTRPLAGRGCHQRAPAPDLAPGARAPGLRRGRHRVPSGPRDGPGRTPESPRGTGAPRNRRGLQGSNARPIGQVRPGVLLTPASSS